MVEPDPGLPGGNVLFIYLYVFQMFKYCIECIVVQKLLYIVNTDSKIKCRSYETNIKVLMVELQKVVVYN